MSDTTVIGSYTPATDDAPAVIDRDYYGQGWIFKDEEAFSNYYDKPCYVPELSDEVYTKQRIIDLCGGREDFARICFEIIDWQSPETLVEEFFVNGEWAECPACGYWYSRYANKAPCGKCGGPLEYKEDEV